MLAQLPSGAEPTSADLVSLSVTVTDKETPLVANGGIVKHVLT